jgi:hypothetical protein
LSSDWQDLVEGLLQLPTRRPITHLRGDLMHDNRLYILEVRAKAPRSRDLSAVHGLRRQGRQRDSLPVDLLERMHGMGEFPCPRAPERAAPAR